MTHFSGITVPPQVIRAACEGDPQAHETIYRACQRPLYSLIRRLIPRAAIADELFQETFVEILRSIHGYSGDGAFGGWVRAIAVNKCLMYLRSPWHRSLLHLDSEEQASAGVTLQTRIDTQLEAQTDLERALASLPPLTRSIVWLHDVEGYTHLEIARLLGRTSSYSKSQLARAHQRPRTARTAIRIIAMHARIDDLLRLRDAQPVDAATAAHVAQCPSCTAQLQRLTLRRTQLQSFPQLDAPACAWEQIQARLSQSGSARPQPRRQRVSAAALAAVAVALIVVVAVREDPSQGPPTAHLQRQAPDAVRVDELVAQSRQLEELLQGLPQRPQVERVATAAAIDTIEQRIQWLDFQLSSPPGDALNEQQAQRLWRERVELMDSLVKVRYAEAGSDWF